MKIGQIVVLYDLSDTRLSVPARRPSPSSNEYLNLVSVCSKWYGRHHQTYFKAPGLPDYMIAVLALRVLLDWELTPLDAVSACFVCPLWVRLLPNTHTESRHGNH